MTARDEKPTFTSRPVDLGLRWIKQGVEHEFDLPGGKKGCWSAVNRGNLSKQTVLVAALTNEGKLVIVKQFRFPVDSFCFEMPGGVVDQGESPAEAMRRELLEETGYETLEEIEPIGRLFLYNAMTNDRAEIYVARGCRKVNDVQPDGVEAYAKLEVLEMDPHELMTMINEGDIRVDPTLAQALLILNHRRLVKLA